MFIFMYMYMYVYVYVYVCMYVCIHIYIYIYIRRPGRRLLGCVCRMCVCVYVCML